MSYPLIPPRPISPLWIPNQPGIDAYQWPPEDRNWRYYIGDNRNEPSFPREGAEDGFDGGTGSEGSEQIERDGEAGRVGGQGKGVDGKAGLGGDGDVSG